MQTFAENWVPTTILLMDHVMDHVIDHVMDHVMDPSFLPCKKTRCIAQMRLFFFSSSFLFVCLVSKSFRFIFI